MPIVSLDDLIQRVVAKSHGDDPLRPTPPPSAGVTALTLKLSAAQQQNHARPLPQKTSQPLVAVTRGSDPATDDAYATFLTRQPQVAAIAVPASVFTALTGQSTAYAAVEQSSSQASAGLLQVVLDDDQTLTDLSAMIAALADETDDNKIFINDITVGMAKTVFGGAIGVYNQQQGGADNAATRDRLRSKRHETTLANASADDDRDQSIARLRRAALGDAVLAPASAAAATPAKKKTVKKKTTAVAKAPAAAHKKTKKKSTPATKTTATK